MEFASVINDNAVFDVKRAKQGVMFGSTAIRICEGIPTVCAVVEFCGSDKQDPEERNCITDIRYAYCSAISICSIELHSILKLCLSHCRCYRMFKLKWLPLVSINVTGSTSIHLETHSVADHCMLITETTHDDEAYLRFYKMKSAPKSKWERLSAGNFLPSV